MAINFLDGISVNGELTTTGATNNITTTNGSSSLYLLNLTRTTTSLTTVGNVGIGTTSPTAGLQVKIGTVATPANYAAFLANDTARFNSNHSNEYGIGIGYVNATTDTFGIQSGTTSGVKPLSLNPFGGDVGIGTTSPSQKLDVSGNINATGTIECTKFIANASTGFEFDIENSNQFNMRHTAANKSMFFVTAAGTGTINFGTNNVNSRVTITSTGALKSTVSLAVGSITPSTTTGRIDASNDVVAFSTSDIRLKDNIKSIDKALDKVNSIQGIEFDWIEKEEVHGNSGHDIGVIAQEIEEILPDVVTTRDNGYKAVKYEKIVPLLIEAIKDLSKQVDGLKRLI
jgi:hypothetical protein